MGTLGDAIGHLNMPKDIGKLNFRDFRDIRDIRDFGLGDIGDAIHNDFRLAGCLPFFKTSVAPTAIQALAPE